jgi:hypothetical protein
MDSSATEPASNQVGVLMACSSGAR